MEKINEPNRKRIVKICFSCQDNFDKVIEKYQEEIEKYKIINEKLTNTLEELLIERYR